MQLFHALVERERLNRWLRYSLAACAVLLLGLSVTIRVLFVTRRASARASQLKSEFLASVGEQVRTPIGGVIGMTDLLLEGGLPREQKEYAEMVKHSATSLQQLLTNVLDFASIHEGRLRLQSVEFDVHALIEDLMDHFAWETRSRKVELISLIGTDVPRVLQGDPVRLHQILHNLVENAVKATTAGEIVLSVDKIDNRPNPAFQFQVLDTGCGIREDLRPAMFHFPNGSSPGSGLGLAIARQLVTAMCGSMDYHSQPGDGSTFWFVVPLGLPAAQLEEAAVNIARADVLCPSPAIGNAIRRRLRSLGVEPTGNRPEVLFLDETASEAPGDVPLIVLTNKPEHHWEEIHQRLRPVAIIQKPVRTSSLLTALSAVPQTVSL